MIRQRKLTLEINFSLTSSTHAPETRWTGKLKEQLFSPQCILFQLAFYQMPVPGWQDIGQSPIWYCSVNQLQSYEGKQYLLPYYVRYNRRKSILSPQCKCNDSNKVKIVKGFGCNKGGVPDCPKQVSPYCKDGTHLTGNNIMRWRAKTAEERVGQGDAYKGCICPDGIMPRLVILLFLVI